jgi:uncharacterized protein (DUF302 family)
MIYGISKQVGTGYDETVARVTEELKKEGFGVLTTIDVRDTLKKKLDVDFPRYVILGACNPPFAHRALQAEEQIGLLLPCNVIVFEKGGKTTVSAFDPMTMTKLVDNPAIAGLAAELKGRLERVIAAV